MEEGEHCQDEEGENERQDNMQGSDSQRERRAPEPSPTISSQAGPHDISKSRCMVPVQSMRDSFPKTPQEAARRSFCSDWYKSHPWIASGSNVHNKWLEVQREMFDGLMNRNKQQH